MPKEFSYFERFIAWTIAILALLTAMIVDALMKLGSIFSPRRPKSFKDKVVVITGGASGLGAALAHKLAEQGSRLALLDICSANDTVAQDICKKYETESAVAFQVDVSSLVALKDTAERIQRHPQLGNVDLLICSAGVLELDTIENLGETEIRRTFDINVLGVIWTIKAFLPQMLKQDVGHIVLISSVSGWTGSPSATAYSGSKFAVRGIAESLDEYFSESHENMKITIAYPMFIDTPLLQRYRITSAYFPLLSPTDAAIQILAAIAREDFEAFIPWTASVVGRMSALMGPNVRQVGKRYLNLTMDKKQQ